MKLLRNLAVLIAIAATGAIGSARAQTPVDLGTLSPTVTQRTDFFASGSFLDVYQFTVDATHNMVTASTVTFAPTGVNPEATHVSSLQMELFDSAGNRLFTGLNLNADLAPGTFAMHVSGLADGPVGGGFSFSISAANPEPAEWLLMLSGLLIAGFIARRKMGLVAG